jgi:hypothetical protein
MRRSLLIAGLLLAGCGRNQLATGVKVDPALATLVPADTVLMVGTRLEALLKTPVYQNYFADRQFSQVEDFARRTGLDPRKDLWELLFISNGRHSELLGRGKFANEMEPKLEKEGAQRFGYKGFNLLGNERGAVMFINSSTAAIGEIEALHSFIDQREKSHGPPEALAALMKEIPADAQFWAAYTGGSITLPFDPNSDLANINKLIGYVQTGSVYFDLRNGLKGVADGLCSNDQGAQQVHDALKALVGIGRLSVPKEQPDLAQVYDTIRVTQESHRVKLYIDVPQPMVDKFLNLWMGRRSR